MDVTDLELKIGESNTERFEMLRSKTLGFKYNKIEKEELKTTQNKYTSDVIFLTRILHSEDFCNSIEAEMEGLNIVYSLEYNWFKIASAFERVLLEDGMPTKVNKLYTFDESLCKQLIPYIRLDKNIRAFSLELNTATEKDFERIKGVGKKLAQRIVHFRKALGGFVDKKQLYEVYGLEAKIVDKIIVNITVDESKINHLLLNKARENEFKKHPYVSLADAKAIIAYREQNGMFTDIDGIDQIDIISSENRKKIKPYLIVE